MNEEQKTMIEVEDKKLDEAQTIDLKAMEGLGLHTSRSFPMK